MKFRTLGILSTLLLARAVAVPVVSLNLYRYANTPIYLGDTMKVEGAVYDNTWYFYSRQWDFNWGDGSPIETVYGLPAIVYHVYDTPGTFTLTYNATFVQYDNIYNPVLFTTTAQGSNTFTVSSVRALDTGNTLILMALGLPVILAAHPRRQSRSGTDQSIGNI